MKRFAVFPGQGAQFPGMGRDLYDASESVRELFSQASHEVGFDVAELLFNGSEEELQATDNTQIAVTLVNLAAARVLRERGVEPERVAGFSLGEYAALVEAGVMDAKDVFPVVRTRGELMERASRALDTEAGPAGMSAVLGLDYDTVQNVLEGEGIENAYPGMFNSPVQTVISGTAEALDRTEPVMKEAGAKRAIRIKVSGPFHSPLMEDARLEFAGALESVTFSDPRLPVYSNVSGEQVIDGDDARRLCIQQLVSPVLWVEEEHAIVRDGSSGLLEVGPGTVLGGLWKAYRKSYPEVELTCHPAGKLEDMEQIPSA